MEFNRNQFFILGLILLVTAIRLGREPASWEPIIVIGVIAGIVAGVATARAILGIASSDQPQSSPGAGLLVIAAVPVIAATSTAANVSCILGGIVVFGDPMPGDTLGIAVQAVAFILVVSAALVTPPPVRAAPANATA